jgi:cobalt-precorrin 5A hydrolase
MKTAAIAITERGAETALKISAATGADLHLRQECLNGKALAGIGDKAVTFEDLSAHVSRIFNEYEGLIFVMSLGIVNRVIAPMIKSKYTDPAVVCHDEVGRFVISVLSGHEGGANGLSYRVSSVTGAEPVVTTATEANRLYTCGIGCRRGARAGEIVKAIKDACKMAGISVDDIRSLASAWVKSDEPGLLEAARELGLYIRFIPKWMIKEYYEKEPLSEKSDFVYESIGVYGVSEPCAMVSGRNTAPVLGKTNFGGITVAIAREQLFRDLINMEAKKTGEREGRILLLGGTTEATEVARELAEEGKDFFISTATEYGRDLFAERFGSRVIRERFSEESLRRFIGEKGIETVIDCTHPYAKLITGLAKMVCEAEGIKYISGIRDLEQMVTIDYERIKTVASVEDGAKEILALGLKRPLFTTGSKDLGFINILKGRDLFVRVLPYEDSVRACLDAGVRRQHIIAMQGPFSAELNIALIMQYGIDCLVTKRTGRAGGFYEKIEAARECGIWVVVVENSKMTEMR